MLEAHEEGGVVVAAAQLLAQFNVRSFSSLIGIASHSALVFDLLTRMAQRATQFHIHGGEDIDPAPSR